MIPTKTYPLSAIIGDEVDDYERGYAQGCEEGRERIAELEAQLKHCEGHAAELETEVKALREAMDKYSEDEMMLNNDTIERCAKVADEFARDLFGLPQKETPVAVIATMETGAAISEAIRALKEGK
jgi:cell division septum initiation protein DivIVA